MAQNLEFRAHPCDGCPWRRDTDLTVFSDDDFAKLTGSSVGIPTEVDDLDTLGKVLGARAMACHRDQPGGQHPLRLCAGWLAVVGHRHAPVRMSVIAGALPETALSPGESWPELYRDLGELLARRLAD